MLIPDTFGRIALAFWAFGREGGQGTFDPRADPWAWRLCVSIAYWRLSVFNCAEAVRDCGYNDHPTSTDTMLSRLVCRHLFRLLFTVADRYLVPLPRPLSCVLG